MMLGNISFHAKLQFDGQLSRHSNTLSRGEGAPKGRVWYADRNLCFPNLFVLFSTPVSLADTPSQEGVFAVRWRFEAKR